MTAAPTRRLLLTAEGTSMLPTIAPGARIALRVAPHVADLAIRPGDIVCYARGRTLVTHRALRRYAGGWLLAGDNGLAGAELVPLAAIWGVVEAYSEPRAVLLVGIRWRAVRAAQLAYVRVLGVRLVPLLVRSARARRMYGLALRASVGLLQSGGIWRNEVPPYSP